MPDIQFIEKGQPPPVYDLIIGLETLALWKAILSFHDLTLTTEHVALPMKSLASLSDEQELHNL